MIDLDNQIDFDFDINFLQEITNKVSKKDLELILVTNKHIQELNNEHRNINKATDVLSFPMDFDFEGMPLGSIVISIDFVKLKAKELEHKEEEELALLYIHGLLHLLGFDHEVDEGQHRKKEEELIKEFNLPSSLIIRNS